MSDFNSSLPIRTESNGDAVVEICDGAVNTQKLNVDASGRITDKINDGAGNPLTSQAQGSQRPLDTQIMTNGANVGPTNPLPVSLSISLGDEVNDYNTAAAVAAAGTSNHDYAITSGKNFKVRKIHASASGKLKIEVQISPDGSTFTSKFVSFNSTATPDINIDLDGALTLSETGTGSKIRVIRTNEDKSSMDVYSTISGNEF